MKRVRERELIEHQQKADIPDVQKTVKGIMASPMGFRAELSTLTPFRSTSFNFPFLTSCHSLSEIIKVDIGTRILIGENQ